MTLPQLVEQMKRRIEEWDDARRRYECAWKDNPTSIGAKFVEGQITSAQEALLAMLPELAAALQALPSNGLPQLVEQWRKRAISSGAISAFAIQKCADELEAALQALPPPPETVAVHLCISCEKPAYVGLRCLQCGFLDGAKTFVDEYHQPDGTLNWNAILNRPELQLASDFKRVEALPPPSPTPREEDMEEIIEIDEDGKVHDPRREETGYVIEKHINSVLHYWDGHYVKVSESKGWSPKHEDAIRFARFEDASIVLAWLLGGEGNVVSHLWMAETPGAALGPQGEQ
jgi:hypothetical protein